MDVHVDVRTEKPTSHCLFQSISSALRNRIPKFRCSKMDIVDAKQIHIFNMPGKGCPPHAKIKIGCVNARQTLVRSRQKARQR
jgi:hypothetical protein